MASTEKISTENNDKDSGFECNVGHFFFVLFIELTKNKEKIFDLLRYV